MLARAVGAFGVVLSKAPKHVTHAHDGECNHD